MGEADRPADTGRRFPVVVAQRDLCCSDQRFERIAASPAARTTLSEVHPDGRMVTVRLDPADHAL
ncbi:hypothetical protein E9529_08625 [Blastococcus sp. KM273128]|uniref:hypothetical protein n=1 Tax=Blastococcus sp. KM273128 TaxID=2570314 RepID=UPI001F2DF6D4|nr:hypothetical protein [Blastococcus sp. KM273128]MCF6744339.1 hypothetical protein [Blastococcus sp. KM273128]